MRDQIRRLPGALRHGGFSKIAILPGEDPAEFEQLHRGLIEEWRPNGPTEDDTVLTMAVATWRKTRLQKFLWAQLCRESDCISALRDLCSVIPPDPVAFERALKTLPKEWANRLRDVLSREYFDSIPDWVSAITKGIAKAMLPEIHPLGELPAERLLEGFNRELALEERLDRQIDRAMKRLIQAKGLKELLYRAPAVEDASKSTSTVRKIATRK
jgi:hypothetical protein